MSLGKAWRSIQIPEFRGGSLGKFGLFRLLFGGFLCCNEGFLGGTWMVDPILFDLCLPLGNPTVTIGLGIRPLACRGT